MRMSDWSSDVCSSDLLIAVRSVSSSTRSSVISQRRGKGLFRELRGWRHIIAPPIAAAMTSETKDDAAGALAAVRGRILRAANDAGRRDDAVALIAGSKTKPAEEIVQLITAGSDERRVGNGWGKRCSCRWVPMPQK